MSHSMYRHIFDVTLIHIDSCSDQSEDSKPIFILDIWGDIQKINDVIISINRGWI